MALIVLAPMLARGQDQAAAWDDEPNELSWPYFAGSRFAFANFADWWAKLPEAQRQAALASAKPLLQPPPAQYQSLWIRGRDLPPLGALVESAGCPQQLPGAHPAGRDEGFSELANHDGGGIF
jgi:hypothetical protein